VKFTNTKNQLLYSILLEQNCQIQKVWTFFCQYLNHKKELTNLIITFSWKKLQNPFFSLTA